jgi:hypothetical protein
MASSDFWRQLAAGFHSIADSGMLRADGWYLDGSNAPWDWWLEGGASDFICAAFGTLARRGASELAEAGATDLLIVWLEALRQDGAGFRITGSSSELPVGGGEPVRRLLGSIPRLCETSGTFCKKLEGRALQAEFKEKQRRDPKNWSPLRQQFETWRKMNKVITEPHERIPESLVRQVIAQQLGIKPEDVTLKQIEFEVSGLLQDYPTITVIPSETQPAAVPAQTAQSSGAGAGTWDTIEILFLSDERVQIRNGPNTETCNYAELGFADGRNENPKQAWKMLRALAAEGVLRNAEEAGVPWPKVEKQIQEIRKVLRKYFGISADPVPFVQDVGYKACFKIGLGRSFHT